MRYTLESQNKICDWQAGFRVGRGVEDQLVRLTQSINDGFQNKKKTTLVLFDFEKAFDKVWRDGVLWKLAEAGVPAKTLSWVQKWMSNRLACVEVGGRRSKMRLIQQGVPQGSVLSPLLFILFIDDLLVELSRSVEVSGFADDLAVWCSGAKLEELEQKLQGAVSTVKEWAEKWLMRVNITKCSATIYSKDPVDANRRSTLSWGSELLKTEKTPTFLGVTFDGRLNFVTHCENIRKKARGRLRLLRCLAGVEWGWRKGLLRSTYTALIKAVLLYASAAWGPWLSETQWEKLEMVQREAARIIAVHVDSCDPRHVRVCWRRQDSMN